MRDSGYRKRLAADLPRWRDAGWVTPEGAGAILAALPVGRPALGVAAIVAIFGGLLVGLSVIAFVSANWQEIPPLGRLGLLAAALALAYGAAGALDRRKLRVFAEAALLVAGLVFAASIAVVGQSYHLSGEFADAVALWLIGIFAAAALTGSPTMTALGLVGGAVWTYLATFDLGSAPHWAGLAPVFVGAGIGTVIASRNDQLLSVLAFIAWLVMAIGSAADHYDWSVIGTILLGASVALLLFAAGAVLTTIANARVAALGRQMLWPGLVMLLIALGIAQEAGSAFAGKGAPTVLAVVLFVAAAALAALAAARKGLAAYDAGAVAVISVASVLYALYVPSTELWARAGGGAIVLVAAVWAVALGQRDTIGVAKSIGLLALGAEVIYLYGVTFGTLMDTAVAFLLGGVLFIILAWGLYRLDRHLARRMAPQPAQEARP
jgi:uncharacterized membrane protein